MFETGENRDFTKYLKKRRLFKKNPNVKKKLKVLHSPVTTKERPKERDVPKSSLTKKRVDDIKSPKDKGSTELRSRENKSRIGKSYQEERQRQAERREELKRKSSTLSKSQSSLSESKISLNETKEEMDKTKTSHSEEKSTVSDRRIRDSERRKIDRNYKKDEIRRSAPRSEGRKDVEESGRRRSGRINELRSFSRKEDDRKEEFGGRRRASEGKRIPEYSNLDRNKERLRGRTTSKKSLDLPINVEKKNDKSNKEQKYDAITVSSSKDDTRVKEDKVNDRLGDSKIMLGENNKSGDKSEAELKNCVKTNEKLCKRRNSLESGTKNGENICDSDKKSQQKEKRRRNSFDSRSNMQNDASMRILTKVKKELDSNTVKQDVINELPNPQTNTEENKTVVQKMQSFKSSKGEVPKRRKSMEERRVDCSKELSNSDKRNIFNRRNSLESGDHKQSSEKFETKIKNEESENREIEGGNKKQHKDPRTVRRIRNKDRPTLEIYRPGMGRFSKQRLEREKVLGSSTEVESPSSSPSPTPVSKPKSAFVREH